MQTTEEREGDRVKEHTHTQQKRKCDDKLNRVDDYFFFLMKK